MTGFAFMFVFLDKATRSQGEQICRHGAQQFWSGIANYKWWECDTPADSEGQHVSRALQLRMRNASLALQVPAIIMQT
jgi:hypothetical protein